MEIAKLSVLSANLINSYWFIDYQLLKRAEKEFQIDQYFSAMFAFSVISIQKTLFVGVLLSNYVLLSV